MRIIKYEEMSRQWIWGKNKSKNKIDGLIWEKHPTDRRIPSEYRGILISNEKLKDKFGDQLPNIAVYGGI